MFNALPWWIYEVAYERVLAQELCAFESEWFSGTSRCMPEHAIEIHGGTFSSWEPGGWNYNKE